MSATSTILNSLISTVRAWWRVDRIRVSPHEGRLLSLETGHTIHVFDVQYRIESQQAVASVNSTQISYELRSDDGTAQLRVNQVSAGPATGEMIRDDSVTPVYDEDVVVLPRPAATS